MPWLADLLAAPEDFSWPLYMSPPHPAAVGSYGVDATRWMLDELGFTCRHWQTLAIRRQLEHDENGDLVWQTVVESTPRRAGKSARVRALALWRMAHPDLFGETQTVVHTASDMPIAREIQRAAWRWAEDVAGWSVTRSNGKEAMETKTGDRWLIRSQTAVYG